MVRKAKVSTETEFRIHPATRPGHVSLTVADLERQLEFYREVVGLQIHWREGARVGLGVGKVDLLLLSEARNARRARGTTGIYHFALLLPNRRELARAIGRLYSSSYPNYPTDHVMTQTTYLDDPEGNNIELYVDTPEEGTFSLTDGDLVARRANGATSSGREPLDVEALFRHLDPEDRLDAPMPQNTTLGHVHLYVADLDATMHFYHELLGFDDMGLARAFRMGMVSAGGYHHHIGFNTWVGEGTSPPPPDTLGLRHFSVVLPNPTELEHVVGRIRRAGIDTEETEGGILVRDPSRNGVLLTTRGDEDL
ncbi:MAG: glyoxalase [Anaerolineales bacterium]|nr:glyoxalase [Anaerolineales bacterium]